MQYVEAMAMVLLRKVGRSCATFWNFWPLREGFSSGGRRETELIEADGHLK